LYVSIDEITENMQRAVANVFDDLKPNASIPSGILISKVLYRLFLKASRKFIPGVPSLVSRRKMTLKLNYIYMKVL
jgi:hypothetical protein